MHHQGDEKNPRRGSIGDIRMSCKEPSGPRPLRPWDESDRGERVDIEVRAPLRPSRLTVYVPDDAEPKVTTLEAVPSIVSTLSFCCDIDARARSSGRSSLPIEEREFEAPGPQLPQSTGFSGFTSRARRPWECQS